MDRVALVTGATRGMGRHIAAALVKEGAQVAINDLEEEKIRQAAEEIGPSAIPFQVDVSNYGQVEKMVTEIEEKFHRIDILVNNAGVLRPTEFDQIDEEEWDFVLDVNLKGVFIVSRLVVPIMKKRRYGKIVSTSSLAGKTVSDLGGAHYTASKAGVLGLTRHMAKELGPFGINVNAICPGMIDTEMARENSSQEQLEAYAESYPIPRLGTPEDVARLVLFLVSDQSSYITGASVDINGGDLMI